MILRSIQEMSIEFAIYSSDFRLSLSNLGLNDSFCSIENREDDGLQKIFTISMEKFLWCI